MATSAFHKWFETFIDEKDLELDLRFTFEVDGVEHDMGYWSVVEQIRECHNPKEQKTIKDTIVKIDFMNGNILHFFRHLGGCMAQAA